MIIFLVYSAFDESSLPVEDFVDNGQVVGRRECSDLEETVEEHAEAHLVTGAVVDARGVAKPFRQVLLDLRYGSVIWRRQRIVQQLHGSLSRDKPTFNGLFSAMKAEHYTRTGYLNLNIKQCLFPS